MFRFANPFRRNFLGIDLGTAHTLVYRKNDGIVMRIPSVIAYNAETGEIIAIGEDAKKMYGKTPEGIFAKRPIKDGVIENLELVQEFLSYIIKSQSRFISPVLIVGIPAGANDVERKAVIDAGEGAGAREVYLIEEPIASALGMGLPIHEPKGHLIVDIGGGTTEIAIISLSKIAHQNSIKVAGDEIDDAIKEYVRRKFTVNIGDLTAEEIKIKLGNAFPLEEEEYMEITGLDLATHKPKPIRLSSSDIREAIDPPINQIISAINRLLEESQPDLVRDVVDNGIYLAGGGALIKGMDKRIENELKIKVNIAKNPLETVVAGIGKVVEDFNTYKDVLSKGRKLLGRRR